MIILCPNTIKHWWYCFECYTVSKDELTGFSNKSEVIWRHLFLAKRNTTTSIENENWNVNLTKLSCFGLIPCVLIWWECDSEAEYLGWSLICKTRYPVMSFEALEFQWRDRLSLWSCQHFFCTVRVISEDRSLPVKFAVKCRQPVPGFATFMPCFTVLFSPTSSWSRLLCALLLDNSCD